MGKIVGCVCLHSVWTEIRDFLEFNGQRCFKKCTLMAGFLNKAEV